MVFLGVVLLIVGVLTAVHLLAVVGIVLILAGLILNLAPGPWVGSGSVRRRYW